MILLSHPTGNTFSRALLGALLERDRLGVFATTIAVAGNERWLKALPAGARKELLRRSFEVAEDRLFTRPWRECARLAAGRLGLKGLDRHETGLFSYDAIYQDLDRALASELDQWRQEKGLTAVYGYEGAALAQFQEASRLGLARCYDLPIAYWETGRRLLQEESERLPEWAVTMAGRHDSEAKCRRKTEEIELAQLVVCPSRFVLESIPAAIRESRTCVVAEFGSPERRNTPKPRAAGEKLRVLFAGSMTQRKGLADVFAAVKLLATDEVELVVMGSPVAPMEFYRSRLANFIYEPPRPHHEVLNLMETCDVFVLPSIVEGRALVQQEAMSGGLPLIATANAGGEDLIEEGRTGFLVPIRSPEAIASKLQWLLENRAALPEMKRFAQEKAANVTWGSYCQKIIGAIEEVESGTLGRGCAEQVGADAEA